MRLYPKLVSKGREDRIIVTDEEEEYQAGLDGYERHWDPKINEREKGTIKEILRVDPNEPEMPKKVVDDGIAERIEPKKRVRRTREQIEADKAKGK